MVTMGIFRFLAAGRLTFVYRLKLREALALYGFVSSYGEEALKVTRQRSGRDRTHVAASVLRPQTIEAPAESRTVRFEVDPGGH